MKKFFLIVLSILSLNISGYCLDRDSIRWIGIKNALENGTVQFINSKDNNYTNHTVFIMKILSLKKREISFSITYISNDKELIDVNPSHYFYSNNRLVLIRTDTLNSIFTLRSGYRLFGEVQKAEALHILAGPNNFITGQSPPVMIFHYKRKKLTGKYYKAAYLFDAKYK
jgi:hypothetical protein